MKSIKPRKLTNARNIEHLYFHGEVLGVLSAELAERFGFAEERANYLRLYHIEEKSVEKRRGFYHTRFVKEADRNRDRLVVYTREIIRANRNSPSEAMREAAKVLAYVIAPFEKSTTEGYGASSLVGKMVERLQMEPNAQHLATLGLTEAVEQLAQANARYEEVHQERVEEYQRQRQIPTSKVIRLQVDRALRACSKAVNALYLANAMVAKDPEVEALLSGVIDQVNAASQKIARNVATRAARAAGKTEEDFSD